MPDGIHAWARRLPIHGLHVDDPISNPLERLIVRPTSRVCRLGHGVGLWQYAGEFFAKRNMALNLSLPDHLNDLRSGLRVLVREVDWHHLVRISLNRGMCGHRLLRAIYTGRRP